MNLIGTYNTKSFIYIFLRTLSDTADAVIYILFYAPVRKLLVGIWNKINARFGPQRTTSTIRPGLPDFVNVTYLWHCGENILQSTFRYPSFNNNCNKNHSCSLCLGFLLESLKKAELLYHQATECFKRLTWHINTMSKWMMLVRNNLKSCVS